MTNLPESKVDVLILGAGPSGLFAANALARAGVHVKVIDKRPKKVPAGHADGIQPRTIEVLQSYGLADRLLKEGNQMHMAAFYNPSPTGGIERTGRAPDVTAVNPRFPFEVTLHQGAIEQIFIDSMEENGLAVDRPYIPTSIDISDDESLLQDPQSHPVKVVLQRLNAAGEDDGSEIVHAKYVIGCDGAHSWVRKTLGITMDGEQTDFIWGVVDTIPDTDFPDIRNRTAIHSNNGSCMVIPREGDKVRLYVQLAEIPLSQAGRVDKSQMGPEKIMDVARKSLQPFTISFPQAIEWWTLYIIGQRVASKYSVKNRVFIAGDACHTHSPKAGQGMNASMNDTHNLAWKLVHVLRGWAQPSLLDTYEFERRKYAQDLIDFDKKFSSLFSGKPRTDENQDGVSHEQFLEVFQTFGAFTSGIGIHYAPSSIVNVSQQDIASKLVIGQRLPPQTLVRSADARPYELQDLIPSDTRYKVIAFVGDTSDKTQLARVEALAEQLERPDSFLKKFTPPGHRLDSVFALLTVSSTKKEVVNYTDIPPILRPHWSTAFTDDVTIAGNAGGKAYSTFGIPPEGALVIVRPDGYVGLLAGLEDAKAVGDFFDGFLQTRDLSS